MDKERGGLAIQALPLTGMNHGLGNILTTVSQRRRFTTVRLRLTSAHTRRTAGRACPCRLAQCMVIARIRLTCFRPLPLACRRPGHKVSRCYRTILRRIVLLVTVLSPKVTFRFARFRGAMQHLLRPRTSLALMNRPCRQRRLPMKQLLLMDSFLQRALHRPCTARREA